MSLIKIDNVEYDTEALTVEAKEHLEMLLLTEGKLRQLQQDVLITQTARNTYAVELKKLLPTPLERIQANDTIQF
ncbi:MAG: hypothetical protein RIR18_1259 [Pseudomonadota bacterium]|jgi:hypothetical protein